MSNIASRHPRRARLRAAFSLLAAGSVLALLLAGCTAGKSNDDGYIPPSPSPSPTAERAQK